MAEDIAALHALPGLSCVRFNLQGLDLPALTETADHVKDIGVHHASLAAASISLALSSVQLTSLTLSDLSVKVPTGGSVSEELACVGACRSLRVLRLRRVLSSLLQAAASSEVPDVVRSVDVLEHQVVRSLTGLQELELTACVIGERLLARAGALPLLTHLNMAKSVFVSDSLCGDGSGPEGGPSLSLSGRPVVALAEAHALGSGYLRHINLNQVGVGPCPDVSVSHVILTD